MKRPGWSLLLTVSAIAYSGFTCTGPTLPTATEGGGFLVQTLYSPTPGVPP